MRIPKYRKHSSGKGFVEHKGRRHYFPGLHGSQESREAYCSFVSELTKRSTPMTRKSGSLLVGELLVHYMTYARDYYPEGEYLNMRAATRILAEEFASVPVDDFGPLKLKEVQSRLIDRGHVRTHINAMVNRIRRVFKWGVSEEIVRPTLLESLRAVNGLQKGRSDAKESDARTPVNRERIDLVIPFLQPIVQSMVELQWLTGVRSESLCYATPSQFDTSGDVWLWMPKHKTEYRGHKLVVPVGPRGQGIIRAYLSRPVDEYLFNPREGKQGSNGTYNRHYTRSSYRQAVIRACDRAEIERFTPHQIRHSKGDIVRELYGAEAAQAILGHKSLDATQIYARKRLDLAKRVALEIG